MMNRHAALVVFAAAVAICAAGCGSIEKPKVFVEEVRWIGLSIEGLELEVTVKVANPNDFAVEAEKLTYTLELNGVEVVEGRQIERADVPAASSAEVVVPVTVTWEGGARALEDLEEGGEHTWRMRGSVTLRSGLLSKTFKFSERGSFATESDAPDGRAPGDL